MDSFFETLRSVQDEWGACEEIDRWVPVSCITSSWEEIGRTDDFLLRRLYGWKVKVSHEIKERSLSEGDRDNLSDLKREYEILRLMVAQRVAELFVDVQVEELMFHPFKTEEYSEQYIVAAKPRHA